MKLIFVEGIPGSGKSSTARFICLQLERNGVNAELFHESTYPHPILLEEEIHDSDQWQAAYLSKWKTFLSAHAEKQSVLVLESVLFQSPILHLLHLDTPRTQVIRFMEELLSCLSNIDCSLVYLYQKEPGTGIHRLMASRGGEAWLEEKYKSYRHLPYYRNRGLSGKELHLQLLYDYAELASQIYSKSGIRSIAIDNSDWNWDLHYKAIMDFLGYDIYPDSILSFDELAAFVGVFRNEESGLTIQIQQGDEGLTIFGSHKLMPRDKNKFYLSNVSMSLAFLPNEPFSPLEVIVYEKDIVGNRADDGTKFIRIEGSKEGLD